MHDLDSLGESAAEHAYEHDGKHAEIDLQMLADRIYQLMIRDVRLELARAGQIAGRRGG